MKYKVKYEDSDQKVHIRYYHALNATTAKEMFKATASHSIGESVKIINIYEATKTSWESVKF
jgi:hypothetical protein